MSRIKMAMHKLWSNMVVGAGLQQTIKKLWTGFWKEVDRIIGLIAREILKMKTPIVPNKVFFFTQEFRYGCNPKYICEEVLRQGVDLDIVWRISPKERGGVPEYVRGVPAGTFGYYKELFSSNVVVANSYIFLDQTVFLKKKQTLIQTWHGSLGIKRFGKKDMKDSWRRTWASVATGKMSDYCITNSSFVSGSLKNTYWPKTPKMEYGHPRNDLFFDHRKEDRDILRKKLCEEWGLDTQTQFVMYGPTFRDSKGFSCYDIDFKRLVSALKKRFGGEWCVLLRYHPSMAKIKQAKNFYKTDGSYQIRNVTDYLDMQELIAITDIAITDYSSWIYDFMLLRKPGFIFATDINLYNNERGFCYPLETTPFPIATDNMQLEEAILSFDQDRYLTRLEAFLAEKGCVEDGYASKRVVELIKRIMGINDEDRKERAWKRYLDTSKNSPTIFSINNQEYGQEIYLDEEIAGAYEKGSRIFEITLDCIYNPSEPEKEVDFYSVAKVMNKLEDIYVIFDLRSISDYEKIHLICKEIIEKTQHQISILNRIIPVTKSEKMIRAIRNYYDFPLLSEKFEARETV